MSKKTKKTNQKINEKTHTSFLFFKAYKNINNYHFKYTCSVGRTMKRKMGIDTNNINVGKYPLTVTVYVFSISF